jgi:hypothetical protein
VPDKIHGGYYIKARRIQESKIATCSPIVRELWDWLLKEANHKTVTKNGYTVKRGQCFRTIKEMCEGLRWKIGYRICRYNENSMKGAMARLRRLSMIDCAKEPRGNLITICNYNRYQNPKNYERTDERTCDGTTKEPRKNHGMSVH